MRVWQNSRACVSITGIVPESRLARHFRDIAGRVNQQLAAAANEVYM
ncbi:bifunctional adenosylcobinamide kinase/adenosylcobinamide-phosphate guanylyltransferase, partial [Pseudomonas aeruginosa]